MGPDLLSSEHFLYSPIQILYQLLAPLFMAMLELSYVPSSFTCSYVFPIPKGKGLDYTDPNNYRGISVSSTFCKIFEKILMLFILPVALHPLQAGFRKGHSTSHISLVLQEAINYFKEHKLKCLPGCIRLCMAFCPYG